MTPLYRGKTKDIYAHGQNTYEIRFTDRVTVNDAGEIDPGGNNTSDLLLEGQGYACLSMTASIFDHLARNGIPTHMVSYNLDNLSMIVRKASTFTPGLEWVCRWKATGSYVRRYHSVPGVQDGMPLPFPVHEITLKDDAGGDPMIVPDSIVALNMISRNQLDELVALNAKTMSLLHDFFREKGLDLWDIKIEWGQDAETGSLLLIDEVSANGCRAFDKNGERITGHALSACFQG